MKDEYENFNWKGFDVMQLRDVADVLAITNPAHCGSRADTIRRIMEHTRAALPLGDTHGYVATLGWCACSYVDANGAWCYKVTVEPWGVLKALQRAANFVP